MLIINVNNKDYLVIEKQISFFVFILYFHQIYSFFAQQILGRTRKKNVHEISHFFVKVSFAGNPWSV